MSPSTSRRRTRRRLGLLAAPALLLLACAQAPAERKTTAALAAPPGQPVSHRQPSNVMGFEGASWLERPGRVEEEKPEVVLEAMALSPGDVVAEIGAGTGFFSRRIAPLVAPGGRVYAVDIEPRMLGLLRQYATRDGVGANITTVVGAETDPKLPRGAADWILLVDVYHEFQRPKPMLRHIRKALAPGGRVALIEYRTEGDSAAHINAAHRMSVEQVLAEWRPAGFELVERRETLPTQHLFIFRAAP